MELTPIQPAITLADSQIKLINQFNNFPDEINSKFESACNLAKQDLDEKIKFYEWFKQRQLAEIIILKDIMGGCNGILQYKFTGDAGIARQNIKISEWLKICGADNIRLIISIILDWTNRLSNLKPDRKLSDYQIKKIAEVITSQYHLSLGICEVVYILFQGIGGKYGQLYDTLDITTILNWIGAYKKGDIQQSEIEAESLKDSNDLSEISDDTKKMLMRFSSKHGV